MSFDKLIWFFSNAGAFDIVAPVIVPLGIGLFFYQANYLWIISKALYKRARGKGFPHLAPENQHALLVTIPSLLRRRDELEGLQQGIRTAVSNAYPGQLVICACVDGTSEAPVLYAELRRWIGSLSLPEGVHVTCTGGKQREGKGMAIEHGVQHVIRLHEAGVLCFKPRIFFNMDADCELGFGALERMVFELTRRSFWTGKPGMIVTSHVSIPESHYWKGWKHFFSVEGQLSISVAREYMVSLGVGRHNSRVLPHMAASGALYCTWFEVLEDASLWARFLTTLGWKQWIGWWLGAAPPQFSKVKDQLEPLPEGVAGMGDDTWASWLACSAHWQGDRLSFDFPRTPVHAAWAALWTFFIRPYRYDPHAKIYTSTPTTLKGLFKQRVRWNVSRIWTMQRWYWGLVFNWRVGAPAIADVVVSICFNGMVMVGLLLTPFAKVPAMWFAMLLCVEFAYFSVRTVSTFTAITIDGSLRRNWRKLLALPQSGWYHFVFNMLTTVVGFIRQVLGFGLNSGFCPERTLIKGESSRIALAYRLRRAIRLALRSILVGDVPLGWFWFGWRETQWTPNGYAGWDQKTLAPQPIFPDDTNKPKPLPKPIAVPIERNSRPSIAKAARVATR